MRPLFAVAAIASAALSLISCAELPGKPVGNDAPAYAEIIAAANREGKVVVYSVTSAVPLLFRIAGLKNYLAPPIINVNMKIRNSFSFHAESIVDTIVVGSKS